MSIPIIYVTNVTHSTSFYNEVCTPLGITTTAASYDAAQQHFCIASSPSGTLFSLQQSSQVRQSTLTLTANSSTQVTQFHTLAVAFQCGRGTNLISQTDDGTVAKAHDLDGNLLEVKYEHRVRRGSNGGGAIRSPQAPRLQTQNSSNSCREGTTLTTACTAEEAKRVLAWQRTVARSINKSSNGEGSPRALTVRKSKPAAETGVSSSPPPPSSFLSQRSQTQEQQQPRLVPCLMTSLVEPVSAISNFVNDIRTAMPAETSSNTETLDATMLCAAAGAAFAYAMTKCEEDPKKRPELSMAEQGCQMQQPDYGDNVHQPMHQHQLPQPVNAEPSKYCSGSAIEVKPPSMKGSLSETLKHRTDTDGGKLQSDSKTASHKEAGNIKPERLKAETVISKHSTSKSSASASKIKPSKSSSKYASFKTPTAAVTEATGSHSEKSYGISGVPSVRSAKPKHSKAPSSQISYAGTVVPEDSEPNQESSQQKR